MLDLEKGPILIRDCPCETQDKSLRAIPAWSERPGHTCRAWDSRTKSLCTCSLVSSSACRRSTLALCSERRSVSWACKGKAWS